MDENLDTIIIGGGQAGLSLSYYLTRQGREHILLEKDPQVGAAWRRQRWDSFTLVTPNWAFNLPGAEYRGSQPSGYMPRAEILERFERYVAENHLPVRGSSEVLSVEPLEGRFRVHTQDAQACYVARRVVIATGLYQKCKIPSFAAGIPAAVLQLEAGEYRNPAALPPGAVLVVGSAQTGCQIAEEIHESGREVYLCTGTTGRFPRSYRGKDAFEWARQTGFLDRTPDRLPSPRARFAPTPHLTGKNGGHTINLHQFYRNGITLLGHLAGAEDGTLYIAPDLKDNLAKSDKMSLDFLRMIDGYIAQNGIDAPLDESVPLDDAYAAPEILSLDLRRRNIGTIIWAAGFSFDFSRFQGLALDEFGYPLSDRGVTALPGLYVLGLPWMFKQKSGLLLGVGEDAAYLAGHIAR